VTHGWKPAPDTPERLKELREAAGWTQVDLAGLVGRRVSSVSGWERGMAVPPRGVLERLCTRFGWPIGIFGKGGPRPAEIVKGPIRLEHALGSGEAPPLSEMPKADGRSVRDVYTLGVNDVMEWQVLSPAYRVPAQRAMQWLDAMKDAAQKERDEATRVREIAEAALREEIANLRRELHRLQAPGSGARKPQGG